MKASLILWSIIALAATSPKVYGQDIREEIKKAPEPKLTKAPRLLKFIPAPYPLAAQEKGIEGAVEMLVTIGAQGKVVAVEIITSPDPLLTEAAKKAVEQFLFSAAEVDNKPAPIKIRYNYNFKLERVFSPRVPEWLLKGQSRAIGDNSLVGQVREQGSRLPIAGAAIAIPKAGIEVRTDERGRFVVPRLDPGTYDVLVISTEHKRDKVAAIIVAGQQTKIQFYVVPLRENPYEIVVRGKRRETTVSRVTLQRKELTTVPGTFGDPIRVLENLPGMARTPYVGGALLVRGAAPNDSGVYLDGIRIPILYHFLGGPSVINANFLQRIDYYPGNADVRYGRLVAGAVDVQTRNALTDGWHGAVDINLLNTGVFLNIPVTENVSIAAAARRSYIDAILPAVLNSAGQSSTTVLPVYYDYQLRVDIKLGGDNHLTFLAFGSDDQLVLSSGEASDDFGISLDSRISFHNFHARWLHHFGDRVVSKFSPSVGFQLVNFGTGEASLDITTFVVNLREDLEIKLSPKVLLRTGIDAEFRRPQFTAEIPVPIDYRNPAAPTTGMNQLTDETETVDLTFLLGGVGLYVDALIDLSDSLRIIPGVRFDLLFYANGARLSASPRLTARYQLFESTAIKGAFGMYSQAPAPNQANDVYGNPNLVLEQALHFSTGFEQQILPALKLDAQFFYIHRYNMGVRSDAIRFENGLPDPVVFSSEGGGHSFGLEVLLKHEVTRNFYGWLAYTLSRSVARREANGELVRFIFDQTHILTLVASYRFGWGIEAGLRFRLVSGRPETPILGGIFDSDGDFYRSIFGEARSVDRALFHQLDLRVEKTWIFELWRLSLYLDIQNVYNAKNPEATLYDYRLRESGPLPGLPILPTLGIKGSF